jgi:methionine biosynthesis protein MetW
LFADRTDAVSACGLADAITALLNPSRVIDIGCRSGHLLAQFCDRGIECKGLAYSTASLVACRKMGLDVIKIDLNRASPLPLWKADIAISTEFSDNQDPAVFASTLCNMASRYIVMAVPCPTHCDGDKILVAPKDYWVGRLSRRGAHYSWPLSEKLRESARVERSPDKNLLAFAIGRP